MTEHETNRSNQTRKELAIGMIVLGKTYSEIAETLNVTRRTLYSWRQDPEFTEALTMAHDEMRFSAKSRLLALSESAVTAIEESIKSAPHGAVRLSAARLVVDKVVEQPSDEVRLERLIERVLERKLAMLLRAGDADIIDADRRTQ